MVHVIKATGEKELFSKEKLLRSAKRAGVPQALQNQMLAHIENKLYDDIPTSKIYHHILEFLEASPAPHIKAKYSLKQSIMALGPTGYPFEDFVSEILKTQGYTTLLRQTLHGKCITHEIDVVAQKNSEKIMVEAKFHNIPGIKTNVHVSLYTKARFDDVKEKNNLTQAWIVTNTKVTDDAITYALCNNMQIISWSYPERGNLADLIEQSGLTPVTSLTTLSQTQKQELLSQHIVLCRDICSNPLSLASLHLPEDKKQEVIQESAFACKLPPQV